MTGPGGRGHPIVPAAPIVSETDVSTIHEKISVVDSQTKYLSRKFEEAKARSTPYPTKSHLSDKDKEEIENKLSTIFNRESGGSE